LEDAGAAEHSWEGDRFELDGCQEERTFSLIVASSGLIIIIIIIIIVIIIHSRCDFDLVLHCDFDVDSDF